MRKYPDFVPFPIVQFPVKKDVLGDGATIFDWENPIFYEGAIDLLNTKQVVQTPSEVDADYNPIEWHPDICTIYGEDGFVNFVKMPIKELIILLNEYNNERQSCCNPFIACCNPENCKCGGAPKKKKGLHSEK